MDRFVVVLTGPTATGKTKLGVALAHRLNGEVVSADSMQIYRGMTIGTAAPTPKETDGIPHHMVGVISPAENYSVSRYVEDASRCIEDIFSRGKLPILVGGTGLYIDSLLSGRSFAACPDGDGLRETLSAEYDRLGGQEMLSLLGSFDPDSAHRLHPNDKKRIVRAIEVYRLTGKTITEHDAETKLVPPRYSSRRIALTFRNRTDLYARIDLRVEKMFTDGLGAEVQQLLDEGLSPDSTAMQAIGYKETVRAIRSGLSPEIAIPEIQMESRRYAKRQLSYLRRDPDLKWILWDRNPDFVSGLQVSTDFLEEAGI